MSWFIHDNFHNVLMRNIHWFLLCLPDNYVDFLAELKEESILTEQQTLIILQAVPPSRRRSLRVTRIHELAIILRDSRKFIEFFEYLKSKAVGNSDVRHFLMVISTEFSNIPHLYEFRYSFL